MIQPFSVSLSGMTIVKDRVEHAPNAALRHDLLMLSNRSAFFSVSILAVDDARDVALLFRQRFRREVRDGTYVMHCEDALQKLANRIEPQLIVILSDINMPGMGRRSSSASLKFR
jgi:hypothetical protein